MANELYNAAVARLADGTIDFDDNATTTIKVALVTSSYVFDKDHDFFDDITNELSGTGYTAGGNALTNRACNVDNVNDRTELDGDDVTWEGIDAGTAAAAIIYMDTGTPATSCLIAFIDSGFPKVTNGGDLTIEWNTEGIIQFSS